jgi:hypothetical protein
MALRTGMQTLIDTVRGMADAGTAEWTLTTGNDTITYWDDIEVQRVLDRHRQDVIHNPMQTIQGYSGGSVIYKEYRTGYGNIESGSSVFKIENAAGTVSGWTMDYARGVVTFTVDQAGVTYYWTGSTYDLCASAADIWRMKAANVTKMFDFSTDGHSIKRSDRRKEYLAMADYYLEKSTESLVTTKYKRDDL